jgi:hypothetical protein
MTALQAPLVLWFSFSQRRSSSREPTDQEQITILAEIEFDTRTGRGGGGWTRQRMNWGIYAGCRSLLRAQAIQP